MRALSLHQPWAWAVVHGPKRVENREHPSVAGVARSMIGQRFAIHASTTFLQEASKKIRELGWVCPMQVDLAKGAVIGVATITAVLRRGEVTDLEQLPWASGPWCFMLADIGRLARPVPCRGMPGFFYLAAGVEAQVVAQLGEEVARG